MPNAPLDLETSQIIAPYALARALGGLLESLRTVKLVDGVTDTRSEKTRDRHSIQPATLRRMPKSETIVMLATVVVTVATHNLAIGVVGVVVVVVVVVAVTLLARRVAP